MPASIQTPTSSIRSIRTATLVKKFSFITLSLLLLFLLPIVCVDPIVDVAVSKPVSANLTCGFQGPERFFSQLHTGTQASTHLQECLNTNAYPASNINDGDDQTWWQSTSRLSFVGAGMGVLGKPDAVIHIDLQQEFQAEVIVIRFGESLRPGRMLFYKQTSTGLMTMWFYKVTSAIDCKNLYDLPVSTMPTSLQSTPCSPYTTPAVLEELLQFDFSLTAADMKEWNRLKALRIEFYDIDLTLGVSSNANEFQHYTVRSVNILAKCSCNGQLTDCVFNNVTKRYECVCGGFTTGEFCQRCLPLYNNMPYKYATPCEMCNCNSQSPTCVYDTVRLTGVCNACGNFTSGINCETCMDGYYRPSGVAPTASAPCQKCLCLGPYTTGDCLKTADPLQFPGMNPGDCICRPNVVGQSCDKCQEGFYGLSVAGCTDCACQSNGTVASSSSCDSTGQCPCKRFSTGAKCDQCMDGYFNLDAANADGCILCGCDPGGSVSQKCDKITGLCQCRRGVEGRTCDKPASGYFYPEFHHFATEMENLIAPWEKTLPDFSGFGYVAPLEQIPVSTSIDFTGIGGVSAKMFRIVLRYFSSADVTGTLGVGPNDVVSQTFPFSVTACNDRGQWCFAPSEPFSLTPGMMLKVSFTFPTIPDNAKLSLDRVSAVPTAFFNASDILDATANGDFLSKCNVLINNLNSNGALAQECSRYAFSISTSIFDGALLCACNGLGSNDSNSCMPAGGQCFCKPFVTARKCDQCLFKYHSLSATGCKACNCSNVNQDVCDPITGVCLCPPGAEGTDCSKCQVNYYNWNQVKGCMPCGCNAIGSTSLACDVATGACTCKAGVTGIKCDQCMDAFWKLSSLGCEGCSCDPSGSLSSTCDKTTGACQCKANVQGQWCNICKLNSFSISSFSPAGCLQCVCMGVSPTCSSSNLITPPFNLNPPSSSLILVDDSGNPYEATTPSVDASTAMYTASLPVSANLYWALPQIKGDLLSLYGSKLSWNVRWTSLTNQPPVTSPQNPAVVLIGRGDQRFIFQIRNYTPPAANNVTSLSSKQVLIHVEDYQLANITRNKILVALSDIKALLIPAVFSQEEHQSSIGGVQIELDAKLVESCLCPTGYEGRSCERCSVGYTRVDVSSQGYLGNCAPCSCNGRATTCDADTGECSNCQQFTTGSSCEDCLPGHYREPLEGTGGECKQCPCEGPRVQKSDCAYVDNVLTCLNCSQGYKEALCNVCEEGYYGDLSSSLASSCKPCQCNSRSVECDLGGVCQNCSGSTIGDHCERCVPGMFMDASSGQCADCNCNVNGSESVNCDGMSGQCACKPGVTGRMCDQCMENFYDFSDAGCTACGCNKYGSASLQCTDQGVCTCKQNTTNDKCDACQAGFYGLVNNRSCQLCGCDPLGTVRERLYECDAVTGQCFCMPSVVGRRCNVCKSLHYSATEILNCVPCGQCESSLGEDVIAMNDNAKLRFVPLLESLTSLYVQDSQLAAEQSALDWYCASLGECKAGVNLFEVFKNNVSSMVTQCTQWKQKADSMNLRAVSINAVLQQLNNESHILLASVQLLKQQADQIRRDHASQMALTNSQISTLTANNASAHILWQGQPYNGSTFVALPWTHAGMFDQQSASINDLTTNTKALAARADALSVQLNQLLQRTSAIQASVQASQNLFSSTANEIQQLNNTINDMLLNLQTLSVTIANTMNIKASADSNFQRVQALVLSTGASLQDTQASLTACQQTLTQTTNLIYGNWTVRPPVFDQTGFRGWAQAFFVVQQLLQTSKRSLTTSQAKIAPAENQAKALSTKATTTRGAFNAVKGRGQEAVDVIAKFEGVIKDLESSIVQARTLNATLQTLMNYLNSVPVEQLLSQASEVLNTSEELKKNIETIISNTKTPELSTQLEAARERFSASVNQWTSIDARLTAFNNEYQSLQNFVNDLTPKLAKDFSDGMARSDAINTKISARATEHSNLETSLQSISTNIDQVSSSVTQSYVTQSQLAANMTNFRALLDQAAQASLTSTNTTQATISALKPALDEKFSRADATLKRLQAKLASMEHPVFFPSNTFEQVANPDVDKDPVHNSMSFDFMFRSTARGVLMFVENNLSNEKILLQLLNSSVCFSVANVQVNEMVCNYARLNANEWYHVFATRYSMDLKLTVTRKLTGGSVSVSTRSSLTSTPRITLNSPVYVGGLALNAKNIQKVYDKGVGFNGCIYRVSFNGATLPVWQNILKTGSSVTCCKKPPTTRFEAVITPCTTFYGFGYAAYNPSPNFNINPDGQIYLQFRTFKRQGVIFLVSSFSSQDFYAVFLRNGRLMYSLNTQNTPLVITSDLTYVSGKWYQLTVTHTTTKMSLRIDSTGETLTNLEYKEKDGVINLSSLQNSPFILGGQYPTYTRGAVSESFAGHIKDFKHTTASSSVPVEVAHSVNSSVNVDLTTCLEEVKKGLGVRDSGYTTVLPSVSPIQTIDFTFLTTQHSGVIFYTPLEQASSDSNNFLYIALYNGDIFLLFNQGNGVQPVTRSRNLNLADGRTHRVSLHFGFVNSPRLKVDNLETHVGAVSMNAYMKLRENMAYFGGVPASISLDDDVIPVDESFVGGFQQLKINDVEVAFLNDGVVTSSNSKQVDLSGIMTQRDVTKPPCDPCPSPPSKLQCILPPPPTSTYDRNTFNFGEEEESFLQYSVAGRESQFVHGFAFQMKFRSLQPDGLMIYIANSPSSFLTDYYAIYLHRGYINAVLMNSNVPKSVVSKKTYYDGNWHSLVVFRVGDFLAILVEDSFDYNNNNQDSSVRLPITNFVINSPLYVGGVPLNITLFPPSIPIGKTSFKGCISSLSLQSQNNAVQLPLDKMLQRVNVGLCTVGKQLGMLMTSSNSYVRASDGYDPTTVYNLAPSFSISLTFKTSSQDGVLMVAWSSPASFAALSLVKGEFQLILGSSSQPFVFVTKTFETAFDVCNNTFHTIKLAIETSAVTLKINETPEQRKDLNGFVYSPPLSVPIYLGGVKDPTWSIPNLFSGNSLSGCIQRCIINEKLIFITQSPEIRNALSGCN